MIHFVNKRYEIIASSRTRSRSTNVLEGVSSELSWCLTQQPSEGGFWRKQAWVEHWMQANSWCCLVKLPRGKVTGALETLLVAGLQCIDESILAH